MKNKGFFKRLAGTPTSIKLAIIGVIVLWTIIVAALVAGALLLLDRPEQALQSTPEWGIPKIVLEPAAGPAGTSVTIHGEGWNPGDVILIYLVPPDGTERPDNAVAGSAADEEGRFTASLVIPAGPESQGLATVIAEAASGSGASAQASFDLVSASEGPTATAVASIEPSAAPTQTPVTPTAAPRPDRPTASAVTDLNIRAGPGVDYPVLGMLRAGQSAEVTGISTDGRWWQIEFPGAGDSQAGGTPGRGWLVASYVTIEGTEDVSVAQAPPLPATPTLAPTPTALPTSTPVPAPVVITDWRGEYYRDRDLSGDPVLVRNDVEVNFDWGRGGPADDVGADDFSARWTRSLSFPAGTYRFQAHVDDGVRLWIDEAVVIDEWHDGSAAIYSADVNLTHGVHEIKVEYYERSGAALARLAWGRTEGYPDWKTEYYNNPDLEGDPFLVRNETQIDRDWGEGAPVPGVWLDNFSVRWTREVDFEDGTYRFRARADDGIRLWIDEALVIDKWDQGGSHFVEVEHPISGGQHRVTVEYYEYGGDAYIQVAWEETNQVPQVALSGPDTADEGSSVDFDGSGSKDLDGEIVKYEWDFDYAGDSFVVDATGEKVRTSYDDGRRTVRVALRVRDDQGATSTATTTLEVQNVAPTAEAGGPYAGQEGVPMDIAGGGADPGPVDQESLTYHWDFGDGGEGDGPTVGHSYAQAGVYTLTLTVADKDGAQGVDTTTAQVSAVDRPPPTAVITGPTTAAVSQTIQFDGAGSRDDGEIAGYDWEFGDGAVGQGITVTHAYTQAGTYTATLTVTNGEGLTDAATHTVEIGLPPTAVICAPPTGVVSRMLRFNGGGSRDDGEVVGYGWEFGDGATTGAITPTHTYAQAGVYTATLTVTDDDGLTDVATHTLQIAEPGPADRPPTAVICGPSTAALSRTAGFDGAGSVDDGEIVRYAWEMGDGVTTAGIFATHTYTGVGVYTVTLTVTDDGGLTDAATHTVKIGLPPTALICAPPAGVVSRTLRFNGAGSRDDGGIVDYAWGFGDGGAMSGVTTTHAYTRAGVYTAMLTVADDDGLTGAMTHTIRIEDPGSTNVPPTAVICGPSTEAVSQTVQFDGGSSVDDGEIVGYGWVFGDGAAADRMAVTQTYTQAGVYTVTLTVTDEDGLTGDVTHTIQITEPGPVD